MAEPRYLLDTNILVYLITGASAELTARVDAEGDGRMATSSLCVAEALAGERSEAEIDAVLAAAGRIPALPFDLDAALAYRAVPFKRRRIDRFIGAQALARGLVLVTNNVADFADIPGLAVEDWTA